MLHIIRQPILNNPHWFVLSLYICLRVLAMIKPIFFLLFLIFLITLSKYHYIQLIGMRNLYREIEN